MPVYNAVKEDFMNGATDWDTTDIRCMLVKTTYTFNADHLTVDDGSANDPASHELVATNYVRKTVPTRTVVRVDASDRAEARHGVITWTALGGAANDTIHGIVFYVHNAADAAARLIAFDDVTNLTTNGSDVTYTPAAAGLIQAS
jgi:hypothetical protein